MAIEIRAYCNGDEASIVWRASERIPGCRGFALQRQGMSATGATTDDMLSTYVGFAGAVPPPPPGTHRPSTQWPIQRFLWRDFQAGDSASVRYRVVPMLGTAASLQQAPDAACSDWTPWLTVSTGQTPGFKAYFNRGIVAAQWLSRRLNVPPNQEHSKLAEVIADPTSPIRAYLGGADREALLDLLAGAKAGGQVLYASLYELDDPELIPAMTALGPAFNLLLGSGAFDAQKGKPDENADVRARLKAAGGVHVFDRIVKGSHFAHNKFVVVCDASGAPQKVWTGSTNWTETGLCTQANNGLLIEDSTLAKGYLAYWHRLQAAGNAYPPDLIKANQQPVTSTVGTSAVTAWTVPVAKQADLAFARSKIQAATQGVLFLMFVPGTRGTLLNDILALNDQHLFVHGVVNQDPGGSKNPIIKIVQRGTVLGANPDVILPAAISKTLAYWQPELKQYSTAMIHSKVVVIDPFGAHPVVMTGSHNLGPKASGKNDDNLIVIEDAPGLAAEYAVNILGVYDQYKWRYNQLIESRAAQPAGAAGPAGAAAQAGGQAAAAQAAGQPGAAGVTPAAQQQTWSGLQDNDTWQDEFFGGPKQKELRFWFGESPVPAAPGM